MVYILRGPFITVPTLTLTICYQRVGGSISPFRGNNLQNVHLILDDLLISRHLPAKPASHLPEKCFNRVNMLDLDVSFAGHSLQVSYWMNPHV